MSERTQRDVNRAGGGRRGLLVLAFVIAAAIALGYVALIWQEAVPLAPTLPRP